MTDLTVKDQRKHRLNFPPGEAAIDSIIQSATKNAIPFALWSLPGEKTKHLLLNLSGNCGAYTESLENLPAGFIFSPFSKEEEHIFIPADLLITFSKELPAPTISISNATVRAIAENFIEAALKPSEARQKYYPAQIENEDIKKAGFLGIVSTALEYIQKGVFEKVVPSRTKTIAIPPDFDVIHAYKSLCDIYENAFVSLVAIPGLGTWMGATPETLIAVDQQFFHTEALAGTQPTRAGEHLADTAWTQKEIEEQAMVSRYIINCFKKIRLREYEEYGPKTTVAGNLLHLKTVYKVDLQATRFPQLGSVMLELLHPTSAVCGMPKDEALTFLLAHEKYDRSFYSGFLGPVNIDAKTNLYVNLRCMQLGQDSAVLYAGAGVTADSNPEKEWLETEMKFNTLLNVIKSSLP